MTDKENLKKMNQIYIQTQTLVEFIKKNEVAWQMYDSLIEFSWAEKYGLTAEEKKDYDIKNSEMLACLANSQSCKIFNPKYDNHEGFNELIKWSGDNDLLILVDERLMLCIALCDKKFVLSEKQ